MDDEHPSRRIAELMAATEKSVKATERALLAVEALVGQMKGLVAELKKALADLDPQPAPPTKRRRRATPAT
jgi:hypothetical protein